MKSTPDCAKRAGTPGWPAARALGLLAIAALQMPCSSAATPDKKYAGKCLECHGQDLKGIVHRHAPDLNGRAIPHGGENIDSAPNEIFMIAGGVSISAVAGLFMLGFSGAREPIHPAEPDQTRKRKGIWET